MIPRVLLALVAVVPLVAAGALAQRPAPDLSRDEPSLTGPAPFPEVTPAPPMAPDVTDDVRRRRNYPEQPPVIPHAIRDYQIDLNVNKCLTCHSRKYTEQSQAPMISITHYQDREGNMLGALAPRRYFCTACHVSQTAANPLVTNTFRDFDAITEDPLAGRR